jgi:hypothetical protein
MASPGCKATLRGSEIVDEDDELAKPGEGVSLLDEVVRTL